MTPQKICLLVATILLGPSAARAASEPPWYGTVDCRQDDLSKDALPATLSKDKVIHEVLGRPLIASQTEHEFTCNVLGKQWKSQKQPTLLVFLETWLYKKGDGGGREAGPHQLRIGMYQQDPGGSYRLAAKSSQPTDFAEAEKLGFLDFAPYKLTPTEYAFGVRWRRQFWYVGDGFGQQESLVLYRVQGDAIHPILTTLMQSESERAVGEPLEDGTRDRVSRGGDATAEISVSKTRTRSFFDLKKTYAGRWAVFKWNGTAYELRRRDPVEDANPDP